MTVHNSKVRADRGSIHHPVAILLIAVWFGLAAGLVEVSLAGAGKFILHNYTHLNPHIAWMTPSGTAIILAIPGLFFSGLYWAWSSKTALRAALFVFAFMAFLSVLFRTNRLQTEVAVLLAIGLAIIASILIASRQREFYRCVRLTIGFLVAAVLVLVVAVYGWQALAERSALAKLPPPPIGAPNVLFIVIDAASAQHLSLYGYSRRTSPELEKLAETGVSFERAIATAPWTLPSHASLFTGRYPNELSANWQEPLDSTYPTLAESLSERGYVTAGFTGNFIATTRESGLSRGFAHYEDFPITPQLVILNSGLVKPEVMHKQALINMGFDDLYYGRKSAEKINEGFLSWLSRTEAQRPFFAFLNYYDGHAPYFQPKSFSRRFGKEKPTGNVHLGPVKDWPASEVQAELDAYDNSIAYVDHQLGLLLEELRKRNVLQNTLVIVTGDHGEEFYEHGVMAHGWSNYMRSLHVPLVISFPSRLPAGKRVSEPVTLRDLPATLVDQLGLGNKFPGTSLARYWDSSRDFSGALNSPVLSVLDQEGGDLPKEFPIVRGNGYLQSLVLDQYQYIRSRDGREELYDFVNDPLETKNLVNSDKGREILGRFRAELLKATANQTP